MLELKETAKNIVELLYGGGDLTSERSLIARAEQGTACHQHIQGLYKEKDKKEVSVSLEDDYKNYHLVITGRIDGLIYRSNRFILEEIKSTNNDLNLLDENTYPSHLAQAKMYAYMYLKANDKKSIYIRLTYCTVEKFKTIFFENKYTIDELEIFFYTTIDNYLSWIEKLDDHEERRNKSILGLNFPFDDFRPGQREFMGMCYRTIIEKGILYAIAPTGIGKTIATIFSGLKAISTKKDKLFYLTAKNGGKKIAVDTSNILLNKGLVAKTCVISSKDSMCLREVRECDPEVCKYAKEYYTKVFKVIRLLYDDHDIFTSEIISEYGLKHEVCPFELSLDISNLSDIIIADYNYVFDPRIKLERYFNDETSYRPIILIDEAHNMVTRGRDMYSASISKFQILSLKKNLTGIRPTARREIAAVLEIFNEYELELEETDLTMYEEKDDMLTGMLKKLMNKIETITNDNVGFAGKNDVLNVYFEIYKYMKIIEYYNEKFVFTVEKINSDTVISVKCLDASDFILKTLKDRTYGSVFFSATMFPIEYYQKLLTKDDGNIAKFISPFDRDNLKLIAVDDISTRYNDRENSVSKIVEIINILASGKVGNYIVFFPSYQYLNMIADKINELKPDYEMIIQKRDLTVKEKDEYIELFKQNLTVSQVGFFVLGGTFAEGIDYLGDMLSGVVIVGTGLPMYGGYNNLLKSFFDKEFGNGFDYAYTFPGLSKVIQAVGRVIRSENDRGVAILVDDRFSSYKYKKLYPREWNHMKVINDLHLLEKEIKDFWKQ